MSRLTYKHTFRACYFGYITQAIINNLAPVLFIVFYEQFGLSYEMLGRLIMLNFFTQLVIDMILGKIADKIGYRPLLISAFLFASAGIALLSVLPTILPDETKYIGLCVSVVIYGIGGGSLEVLVSPIVDTITDESEKSAKMNFLHSFYCWGQAGAILITTVTLSIFGIGIWTYIPLLWALVPFITSIVFTQVPLPETVPDENRQGIKILFKRPLFFVFFIIMFASGASELTMSQWSSLFAQNGLGMSKMFGDLAGPCLFAICMGTMRMAMGKITKRWKTINVMLVSASICILSYIISALSGNALISLIFCAVCGLSVSMMWPSTISMAAGIYHGAGTTLFAVLAVGGDLGASVAPWIAGLVADASGKGIAAGLLAGAFFPMTLAIALFYVIKKERSGY